MWAIPEASRACAMLLPKACEPWENQTHIVTMKLIKPISGNRKLGIALLTIASALLSLEANAGQGPQPSICTRACWGARAPNCSITQMSGLSRAIVHHTAGTGDYSTNLENTKAVMRNVQNYHMGLSGWCDIAYHFLVDAAGNVFEGRSGALTGLPRGTHDGCNANSLGFTALGYYHPPYNQVFTSASRNAMEAVIAWRMPSAWSPYGSGTYCSASVGFLDGHYRVKSTACPGDGIIPQLPGIRDGVNARKNGGSPAPLPFKFGDYDGDRKADAAVFSPSTGRWSISGTAGGQWGLTFGYGSDIVVPHDYDGDRKTDAAIYRPSTGYWHISGTAGGSWTVPFGLSTDIPVPADYDGDKRADAAIFRPSTGEWHISGSTAGFWKLTFGYGTDIVVPSDYDGDGKTDAAVWRPSNGTWYISGSAGGYWTVQWGIDGDCPVPADYDGDGKTDAAVFRRSTGVWYFTSSKTGATWTTTFGYGSDIPVPCDYDNDGRVDAAVYRPSEGKWYISGSTAGVWAAQWGASGDIPLNLPSAIRTSVYGF